MEYPFIVFTLAAIWHLPCCSTHENELCYLRKGDAESVLCTSPDQTVPCCFEDIRVTVYGDEHCDSVTACGSSNFNCCARTSEINISEQYRSDLEQTFRFSNCFKSVVPPYGFRMLPKNTNLDLVVVSYSCRDKADTTTTVPTTLSTRTETTGTTTTSPKALPPTRVTTKTLATPTAQATTQHIATDSHETTTIVVSITCSVIIILLAAIVTGICVYRRINTEAAIQLSDKMPQSNNIHVQEPIAGNNDVNVVPPTYEQLLHLTNDGEYSQIIGHTAAAQTPEPGNRDPHSGQGRIYVNIVETTYEHLLGDRVNNRVNNIYSELSMGK